MKRVKRNFDKIVLGSIVEDALYACFSIFLLVKPATANAFLLRLFGLLVIISGLFSLIRFVFKGLNSSIFKVSIINCAIKVLLGVIVLLKPDLINNLLAISAGVVILVNGLIKLYYAFNFYNNKEEIWPLIGIISIGLIIMGGALIINPFSQLVIITRVIGVFVLCYALFDGMQWMLFRKRYSEILKLFK